MGSTKFLTLIQVSYIDNETHHSLEQAIASGVLDNYDVASIPFLKEYFGHGNSVQVSTSGSTGTPKMIKLEKEKMIASAKATLGFFHLIKGQTILLCLPTQFIAGKMIWVRALEGDLKVVVAKPTSNPIKHLETHIDFAAMTPHQVAVALDENPEKFDLIEQLIIGGGAVDSILLKRLQGIKTQCFATYGMTETITHIAVKKLNGENTDDHYEAIDKTTFTEGENQNLIIHAPHLTADPIVTNDIVNLIDHRHFEWLGRLDFVINSGGVKLFPEQIEKKLEAIIDRNFFVWKEDDELLGEKLILILEGNPFDLPNLDEYLSKLEIPKAIYFIPEFSMTANGKLNRLATFSKISN